MEWDLQAKAAIQPVPVFNHKLAKEVPIHSTLAAEQPQIPDAITSFQREAPCKIKKKRSRTGSLTFHHNDPRDRSLPSCSTYRDLPAPGPSNVAYRKLPIAGGSWDDNSLGHGSVAARMRRERNRAILRTQSSTINSIGGPIDTHANVTSTLNLINTTALSPWDDRYSDNEPWLRFPWERHQHSYYSAATRQTGGSTHNMATTSLQCNQPWDTLSTPDFHSSMKMCDRACQKTHRHSYSSGNAHNVSHLHSSTTSGCASIASSDLDSADFMFFNINDDSAYFDGDSMFSESMLDGGNSFNTNILSLLEEGSISCRTPFPASDWPDSISELDFDCNDGGMSEDVANCDALSDIGPSCSTPPHRRRMPKATNIRTDNYSYGGTANEYCASETYIACNPLQIAADVPEPTPEETPDEILGEPVNVDMFLNHSSITTVAVAQPEVAKETSPIVIETKDNELPWFMMTQEKREEYIEGLSKRIAETLNIQEQLDIIRILNPQKAIPPVKIPFKIPVDDIDVHKLQKVLGYLQDKQKHSLDGSVDQWTEIGSNSTEKCNLTIDESYHSVKIAVENSNNIVYCKKSKSKKVNGSPSCEMVLRERPGSRVEHVSDEPKHVESCSDEKCKGCASNLRRSNSDGNLPKSTMSEAQKEHRRRQRQARRWAKWLKQRQRKENRQLKKEHKSGLFVKEQRVKLESGRSEGENTDIEV